MLEIQYYLYIILPSVAVFLAWKKGGFKIKAYKPFMVFLIYSLFTEIILTVLANYGIRNVFMVNIYNVVNSFLLATFFFRLFYEGKTHIKWYLLVCLPAVVLYFTHLNDFNNDMILLDIYYKMGVSIAACTWLVKLMLNTHVSPIKTPSFWFSVSLIMFNLGTIVVFNMSRFWDAGAGEWLIDIFRTIVFTNIFIYYLLIIVGCLCISKNSTSKYSY